MTLLPDFNQAEFEPNTPIDNPYFPLVPGSLYVYEAEEFEDDTGEIEVEQENVFVTSETQDILGINSQVVRENSFENGVLSEEELAYYAQDTEGNVWLLGESSIEYEYDDAGNLIETEVESWQAGQGESLPGYAMIANPEVGDIYYEQFQAGEEEDQVEVLSVDSSVSIDFGSFENVLQVQESSPLEPDEIEFNYFAPGIGEILEEDIEDGELDSASELVEISTFSGATLPTLLTADFEASTEIDNPYFPLTPGSFYIYESEEFEDDTGEIEAEQEIVFVTSETQEILGIDSRVVQESEFENGVLSEEGLAYYAQDTEGNVWLLGESSTEYEYDDAGNLIETEVESWQAGLDQSLPGYAMIASPEVGDIYYEQFQVGEEEEQAEVLSVDSSVSIDFGSFENVLQVQESSPLEPDEIEFNYFAPGIGEILEEDIEDGELDSASELVSTGNVSTQLNGSSDDDILVGEDGDDLIVAFEGDDIVAGGLGDDILFGAEGADILRGDNNGRSPGGSVGGNDTINGGLGNDRIGGKAGNDELFGDEGDDLIWGDDGDDLIRGGLGNDTLTGDDFSGGKGFDTFILATGEGTDTIVDFEVGIDVIGLANLTFADLNLTSENGNVAIGFGDETLAVMEGVEALTDADFTLV